ncbi:MAG: gephyrin-like molybdotransferase Glp [Rhizobium rhizophilum]|uniref:molybdopterin molybdotransferase MoeA n=1 Tax=Rhizobium rhizophilum TaxID=1850373 RepID=UPI00391D204C
MNIKVVATGEDSGCFDGPGKLSFEEAVEAAIRCATAISRSEHIALRDATGRVMACDVKAPSSLPRFNHSAMDGFAIRTSSFSGPGPWQASIEGIVAAGSSANMPNFADEAAVEIYTGAPVPHGFDAVMTRESCVRSGDDLRFHFPPTPGMNIRLAGEDIAEGAVALAAGTVVTAHTAALLAGLGMNEIEVRPKLRVAYVSTGSELRQPGEPLQDGQLFDSNRYMAAAMLSHPWIDYSDLGHLHDKLERITRCLADASTKYDVVVASGGMSAGGADFMRQALLANRGSLSVNSVLMRPGKPAAIGNIADTLFIGLPGNPMAAAVVLNQIGLPALRARAGMHSRRIAGHPAVTSFKLEKREGRTEFIPVKIVGENDIGLPILAKLGRGSSGSLLPMAQAHGIALLAPNTTTVREGDLVKFHEFG